MNVGTYKLTYLQCKSSRKIETTFLKGYEALNTNQIVDSVSKLHCGKSFKWPVMLHRKCNNRVCAYVGVDALKVWFSSIQD